MVEPHSLWFLITSLRGGIERNTRCGCDGTKLFFFFFAVAEEKYVVVFLTGLFLQASLIFLSKARAYAGVTPGA